jgi:hypothetical protein
VYRAGPSDELGFRGMWVTNHERLGVHRKIVHVLESDFQYGCDLLRRCKECFF